MRSTIIFGRSSLRCSPCLIQAHIERGFGVNKEIVVENYILSAYVSNVPSLMPSVFQVIHDNDLPNKLVTSCITSYSHYSAVLKELWSNKQAEKSKKRKILLEKIVNAKWKKLELACCISCLEKDTDNFCSKGEHQHDIAKFLKAKERRKASKSNESTIKDIIWKLRNWKKI